MESILNSVRSVLGTANFYDVANATWDYALMFEYFVCACLLFFVVSGFFKLIGKVISR